MYTIFEVFPTEIKVPIIVVVAMFLGFDWAKYIHTWSAKCACHVLLNYAWVCVCYVNHDLSFYNIIKAFGSREPFKKGLYIWFGPCSRSTINVLPCMRKQFFFWTMFKKTSGQICYFLLYDRVIKYALYWKVICGYFCFTCEER